MSKQQLYAPIWKRALPDMLDLLEVFPHYGSKAIPSKDFKEIGERKDYSFNLQIDFGVVANNIDGSAVARDLAEVFLTDTRAGVFAYDKKINIKLDRNFTLHMSASK